MEHAPTSVCCELGLPDKDELWWGLVLRRSGLSVEIGMGFDMLEEWGTLVSPSARRSRVSLGWDQFQAIAHKDGGLSVRVEESIPMRAAVFRWNCPPGTTEHVCARLAAMREVVDETSKMSFKKATDYVTRMEHPVAYLAPEGGRPSVDIACAVGPEGRLTLQLTWGGASFSTSAHRKDFRRLVAALREAVSERLWGACVYIGAGFSEFRVGVDSEGCAVELATHSANVTWRLEQADFQRMIGAIDSCVTGAGETELTPFERDMLA